VFCAGVNVDLQLRLQAVSAKDLLEPPSASIGGTVKRAPQKRQTR